MKTERKLLCLHILWPLYGGRESVVLFPIVRLPDSLYSDVVGETRDGTMAGVPCAMAEWRRPLIPS